MLCPKCGFISFDHLAVCGKCNNDLSGIGTNLHGTAVDVEGRFFLGQALKEDLGPHEDQPEGTASSAVAIDVPFEQEQSVDAAEEMGSATPDFRQEAATEVFLADEPPALEFELDEITLVDSSSVGVARTEEKAVGEGVDAEEAEVTLLDFGGEDGGGQEDASLSEDEAEIDGEALGIDTSTLTLDSFEEEAAQSASNEESVDEEQSGQLTIDLNAIDLSDLVHSQSGDSPGREEAGSSAEDGGLDFEDTMDLSLFVGETHEVSPVDLEQSSMEKGSDPIDLSLVDEALVDLAVDHGRQEKTFQEEEGHSDILELSMEDSSK